MSEHQFGELRKCFPVCKGPSEGLGRGWVPQWPCSAAQPAQGVFVQTAPQHHSARALSHTQAGLLSSRVTGLLRQGWKPARNDSLSQALPPLCCSCNRFVCSSGASRVKSWAAAAPRALGRAFPAQQPRVRLCSRHIPGGWVCLEPEKSWTPLWTSIINSHLQASWRRWAENHSLCFTLRILHLYVCVKTGGFHKWLCCQGLELCTGNLVLCCITVNNSTFLWIY